jgi:hypothetical protein
MESTISVRSAVTINNNDPLVYMIWQDVEGTLTASDARARGMALIEAIAIAKNEENIVKILAPESKPRKGFGDVNPTKNEVMTAHLIQMLREKQAFIHPDIKPIYGVVNQKGAVYYSWRSVTELLDLNDAKHHATTLIEAAEAAENDSFFYQFFEDKLQLNKEFIEELIQDYKVFKQQQYLENTI